METVVSGIRSTGKLHLGNYYGAIQNFVKMQHEYNCYFFIADLHSLTTHPTPADLHGNVKQVLVEYLAAGLDPEKATIIRSIGRAGNSRIIPLPEYECLCGRAGAQHIV